MSLKNQLSNSDVRNCSFKLISCFLLQSDSVRSRYKKYNFFDENKKFCSTLKSKKTVDKNLCYQRTEKLNMETSFEMKCKFKGKLALGIFKAHWKRKSAKKEKKTFPITVKLSNYPRKIQL